MFVVLGASGHIGSAVAEALLRAGESVAVVVREAAGADRLHRLRAVLDTPRVVIRPTPDGAFVLDFA